MEETAAIAGTIAAIAAGVAGAGYLLRGVWRMTGSIHRLADAILGDGKEKPGLVERVTAMEERLGRVEYQLHPNSGGSLFDKVSRIDEKMGGAGNGEG